MRFFLVLLTVILVQALNGQSVLDKKVSFNASNITINKAIVKLSKESNIDIAFSRNFFKRNHVINLTFENQTIASILSTLLQNTNVEFKELGNRIVLFKKKITYHTLSGYLEDQKTCERLIYATLYSPAHGIGTVSNEYGFYSLTLPAGKSLLECSYLGYEKKVENIELNKNQTQNIGLKSRLELKPVTIRPEKNEVALYRIDNNNSVLLGKKFVKSSPSLAGEEDYLRTYQLLPGVQSGMDGIGSIQVRGGDGSQNLMMLDGVQIYIPYHLLGLFSLYNPVTINSAQLLKSYVPTKYGGRTSSVIDVRTREGNMHEWKTEASINLLNANAMVEGPLFKEKSSMMFAGRYSPTGSLLNSVFKRTYFQDEECGLKTNFHDINLKFNYIISPKDRVYLSIFSGKDSFLKYFDEESKNMDEEPGTEFSWKNTVVSLRWNHLYSDKIFSNTTLTSSLYGYDFSSLDFYLAEDNKGDEEFYFHLKNANNLSYGLKSDYNYMFNSSHKVGFGGGITFQSYQSKDTTLIEKNIDINALDSINRNYLIDIAPIEIDNVYEGYFYLEDQITLSDKLQLNAGIRLSFYYNDKFFLNPEPRLNINYKLSPKTTVSTSINRMTQYIHLLSNKAIRLPSDYWIPSNDEYHPQISWHADVSMNHSLSKGLKLSTSIYAKRFNNLYSFENEKLDFVEDSLNTENFTFNELNGSRTGYGIELMLSYANKSSGGTLSYTISKTDKKIPSVNSGRAIPFMFDRRHQFKLFLYQNIGKNLQLGINWMYLSPQPKIVLISYEGDEPLSQLDINSLDNNSIQTKAYHKLDGSLSYLFKTQKLQHRIKIGAYNVYNRRNISYHKLVEDESDNLNFTPVYSIPFIPSFYYSISF
ncbi:MAG: TonB-dependent receptor [Bacteroidales bacterium]|nr:TonB-dependent receptor [Bacteroidales bacterium]